MFHPKTPLHSLQNMRQEMLRHGLDGYLVPSADCYQNEQVSEDSRRLFWLTGFSGSAGFCVISREKAYVVVDGRYTLQVQEEIDPTFFEWRLKGDAPWEACCLAVFSDQSVVGYDPCLFTHTQVERFSQEALKKNIVFKALRPNLIDRIWEDRPTVKLTEVATHPDAFSGASLGEKLSLVEKKLEKRAFYLLTALDSIAWLFNIRGRDIPFSPLVTARALLGTLPPWRAVLFLDISRVSSSLLEHLEGAGVSVMAFEAFEAYASSLQLSHKILGFDPQTTPQYFTDFFKNHGFELSPLEDPCLYLKACKNITEREGARKAHLYDGLALVRLLTWLSIQEEAPQLTELSVAEKLLEFRSQNPLFEGLSFATIAAYGPHAALPHYHPTPKTNKMLAKNGAFLLDSGGQYLCGTTDITRTLFIGQAPPLFKKHYTAVLKGLIALSEASFSPTVTGGQLDALARLPLWALGIDFDHGTGHGVGSYLNVHEGPQRISKTDRTPLKPGMIVSNEPAYYAAGNYGIRLENLLLVKEMAPKEGAEQPILGFETLTLCPFSRELILEKDLTFSEKTWINRYHTRVFATLAPELDQKERLWLEAETALI